MIRAPLLALRERRALLVAGAEEQRGAVLAIVGKVERATAWYDHAKAIGRKVRANSLWVVAGVALLFAARPARSLKLLATGFSLWRTWRRVSAVLDRFAPPQPVARRAH